MAKVFTSSVISAPVESVWRRIRDFNGLASWHPAVARSRIEDGLPSDRVGCVRNFELRDGGVIRETLLALDDIEHRCTYDIIESPMPLQNYVATLALLPVTNGDRTYAQWTATFDCDPADREDLVRSIGQDVFQAGFDALQEELGR